MIGTRVQSRELEGWLDTESLKKEGGSPPYGPTLLGCAGLLLAGFCIEEIIDHGNDNSPAFHQCNVSCIWQDRQAR